MHSQWLFPIVLLQAVLCAALNSTLGPKITGAIPAEPFKQPWLASIQYLGRHMCGGILLDATTLITSGYCLGNSVFNSLLRVQVGRYKLSSRLKSENAFQFKVKSKVVHPDYDMYAYNVAVWKLQLTHGDPKKLPVGMVSLDDGTFTKVGTQLQTASWGSPGLPKDRSDILLQAQFDVVSNENCLEQIQAINGTGLCVFSPDVLPCTCDTGAPLFYEKQDGKIALVGITNIALDCAARDHDSAIYTKISSVAEWIKSKK